MAPRAQQAKKKHGPLDYQGPGRPPKLDREKLESICKARGMAMSIVRACKAHYVTPATYHNWFARGAEDALAGRRTLYAEFFDRVPCEDARGELFLRGIIHRAIQALGKTASKEEREAGRAAMEQARLALATLQMRLGGAKGAERRKAKSQGGGEDGEQPKPASTPGAETLDLSVYSPEELDQLKSLIAKGRRRVPGGV